MKKAILILTILCFGYNNVFAQVAISTTGSTPSSSAMLDVTSTTKGILIPRMTTTQRDQISSPANGLMIFDTDTKSFQFYESASTSWIEVISSNNNTELKDADGDTKIQVEEADDEDKIRFDIGGTEYFVMEKGRFQINNDNTLVGNDAGYHTDNNTSEACTFIGSDAGYWNYQGFGNTAIGSLAGFKGQNTNHNTATGYKALSENNSGNSNTANGAFSLINNDSGQKNVGIGFASLYTNNTGSYNVAVGADAMGSAKYRNHIVAIGDSALYNNGYGATNTDHGSLNTALGSKALFVNTLGYANTASGNQTMYSNTTGTGNTATGASAMILNTTGNNNTANGYMALAKNTTGFSNVAIGISALFNNTQTHNMVAIGDSAMFSWVGADPDMFGGNVAVGSKALFANTSGFANTAVGTQTLKANTSGYDNTAIGGYCLQNNIDGDHNVALGIACLKDNTSGSRNTAAGSGSISISVEASDNSGFGYYTLGFSTTGVENSAFGSYSLNSNTTGSSNIAFGYKSMFTNTIGSYNTIIGSDADVTAEDLNYASAIGYNAKVASSNSLILGGTELAYTYVGIGLSNPMDLLHLQSRAANNASIKVVAPSSYNSSLKLFEASDYGYEFEYDGGDDKLYLWSRMFSGNEAIRMTWLKDGKVGIGTTSPSYLLEVGAAGDGTQARANSWNTFSDRRWKTNIVIINNPIEILESINGYYYNWKGGNDKSTQVGVIAQEIEVVLPEIVTTDDNGYKSVDYSKLTPLLIEAVKQQQQTIKALIERIEVLEKKQ